MGLIRLTVGIAACLALAERPAQAGQGQTQPTTTPAQTSAPTPPLTPDQLERIREAVNRPSTLKLDNGQLRFYVEIVARWPTWAEMTKGYDLLNGPTGKGNPMSHSEMLGMLTPREMYGSGGISAPQMLTMALVNYFGQKAIKKSLKEISEARNEKEIREIRAQIDRELAALRGGK